MQNRKIVPAHFISYCMRVTSSLTDEQLDVIRNVYNELGRNAIYQFGTKSKILPYIAHTLVCADCDSAYWEQIHSRFVERNKKVIQLLDDLFVAFEKSGLHNTICVAENFGAILASDSCLGCFCSGDIDFYCFMTDMEKLDKVLRSFGFSYGDRHTKKKNFAYEYKSNNAIGEEFWLNFQWKPMTRKKTHLYDQRFIFKRYARLFTETDLYKKTHIRIFKPEAAMYLNCVHIASGHYYILMPEIRLLADIDRPARYYGVDWDKIKTWAEEDHLGLRTDTVFRLCELELETPIPAQAYTKNSKNTRFSEFVNSLADNETLRYKQPDKKPLPFLLFLIRTELRSDGTNLFAALCKRLWVLITEWD